MADIPKARALLRRALHKTSDQHVVDLIEAALAEMYREYKTGKAPIRSRKMTAEIADQIVAYRTQHPTASQQHIANKFKVNSGRVSEALTGKWSGRILIFGDKQ